MSDNINHPKHYAQRGGAECIDVAETFNFNLGNVIKYVWRAGEKTENPLEDLFKARWYLEREIENVAANVRIEPEESISELR